jgi:hypothetical protein
MSEHEMSKEEKILRAVKKTLTEVVKDTATEPGLIHPLSNNTINTIRDCLILISSREQELAALAGRSMDMRPRYTDEPKPQGEVVVHMDTSGLGKGKSQ